MSDLADHPARLQDYLARFRQNGIANLIAGEDVAGEASFETRSPRR